MKFPNLPLLALLLLAVALPVSAVDEVFSSDEGAIRGYDPVAYHLEKKPVKGAASISHEWNGASWRFSSAAHRDLFVANPARYAPQYGGYCAFGTSRGYKVSTQPEAFSIVDGKLYLNYSKAVQQTWNEDRAGNIAKADRNWVRLENSAYTPE